MLESADHDPGGDTDPFCESLDIRLLKVPAGKKGPVFSLRNQEILRKAVRFLFFSAAPDLPAPFTFGFDEDIFFSMKKDMARLMKKSEPKMIVTFAVEDGPIDQMEAKARSEMKAKKADYVVVNTPATMGFPESRACILSATDVVLPWGGRPKEVLAREILSLLHGRP